MRDKNRLLIIFVALCLLLSARFGHAEPPGCKIAKFTGSVDIQSPGSGAWRKAQSGEALAEGAQLRTGPKSEAFLIYGGGHAVKVTAMSMMKVSFQSTDAKTANNGLQISQGKAFAKVSKLGAKESFRVTTPTAVAGVRGTQFSVDVAASAGPAATLAGVKGKVELRKSGATEWDKAKEGAKVYKGDAIRTGANGSCALAWGKGNVALIQPVSQIVVDELGSGTAGAKKKNELTLSTGRAMVSAKKFSNAESSFSVRTRTAVAGVRGTKFDIAVSGGDPAKSAGVSGKLMDVSGTVEVLEGGGKWKKAANNTTVKSGDSVRTQANSSCVVVWAKGNAVRISPTTMMKLDKIQTSPATGDDNNVLSVSSGKVFVKAKKLASGGSSFVLKSPTAVAGVRGTQFSMNVVSKTAQENGTAAAPPKTEVACVEGEVAVSSESGAEVAVKQGEKSEVAAGADPAAPAPMSAQEMSDFKSQAGLDNPAFGSAGGEGYPQSKPAETVVRCAEGFVMVSSPDGGAAVALGEGQKTSVSENAPPAEAAPMSAKEINEIKSAPALNNPAYQEMGSAGGAQPATAIECVEGKLEVESAAGGMIEMAEGMKMSVESGQAPQAPEAMSAAEMGAFRSEAAGIEAIETGALNNDAGGDSSAAAMDSLNSTMENTERIETAVDKAIEQSTGTSGVNVILSY